jgi:hypothetical protein
MKWLAAVLIGCAATSAVARTYPQLPAWRARGEDELSYRARVNIIALNEAELAYRQYARADSLVRLLPPEPAVIAGLSPALADPARDTLAALLSREIAAIDRARARTGVFLLDNAYGGHSGVGIHRDLPGREIYAGVDSAGVYCMMVGTGRLTAADSGAIEVDAFRWVREHRRAGILGPCTFFARYGAPGARLALWLEDGAYALAEVPGTAWPIEAAADDLTMWIDLRLRACIAGREDSCSDIVSFELRPPAPGAATARLETAFMHPGNMMRMLLSEMEASFGPERFERFWRSDDDVPVAFASAFGLDIDEWVREWAISHYGVHQPGPTMPAGTLLLSAAAVLLAGCLAAGIAARRTV